jgi:hypothetical protein
MHNAGFDDAERLRILQSASDDASTRPGRTATAGAPCKVAKVSGGSASGLKFFTMIEQLVTGAEVEGGAGTLTPVASNPTFEAINLGSAVPSVGQAVICTGTDYRWVFRYDS